MRKKDLAIVLGVTAMLVLFCGCAALSSVFGTAELVAPEDLDLLVGEQALFSLDFPTEEMREQAVYTSADEAVAIINGEGLVTAVGPGDTHILIETMKQEVRGSVTVTRPPVEAIAFAQQDLALLVGDIHPLALQYSPLGAYEDACFFSSDENIATVDESGHVHANGVGEAVITATSAGKEAQLRVSVDADHVDKLAFSCGYYSVVTGETLAIPVEIAPYGLRAEDLIWEASSDQIGVNGGVVTGLKDGIATVTATAMDGTQASAVVCVSDSAPHAPLAEIAEARFHREDGRLTNGADTGTARIMLAGDLMSLSAQQGAARKGDTFDFNESFSLVRQIFEESDFCMANLETLTSQSCPYTYQQKYLANGLPMCNAPATYLDALRYAGFDAVATANNHCCDGGARGIVETLAQLEKYQIAHTGTFGSAQDERYLMVDVNGIRLGILSYSDIFNGGRGGMTKEEQTAMLNPYTEEKVAEDVKNLRAAGAEFIIAYQHWGAENTHSVTVAQREHAQQMADAGVDLIAGSHPHCLQEAVYLTAQDGRVVLCMYSMGNFVSSMPRGINNDTIILDITLERTESGVALAKAGYHTCKVLSSFQQQRYVVVPCAQEYHSAKESAALQSTQSRIAAVVGNALEIW